MRISDWSSDVCSSDLLDKDLTGYRPEAGTRDRYGNEVDDRIYNQRDFDRTLVLDERTKLVASKITEFLKATNRFDKTIVFCEDTEHAERMRQALATANADLVAENHSYIMRREEERRVGQEWFNTCRSRWWPDH